MFIFLLIAVVFFPLWLILTGISKEPIKTKKETQNQFIFVEDPETKPETVEETESKPEPVEETETKPETENWEDIDDEMTEEECDFGLYGK